MIIYIYGEDSFRSRKYLDQSIGRFKKERDPQGYNIVQVNGKTEDAGKIWSEITAAPFLAEKKMVVIKNVLSSKDEEVLEMLLQNIIDKKVPENNVVIFWQDEAQSKLKLAGKLEKKLREEKWAMEFSTLDAPKLRAWIMEEIKNRGGKINSAAVDYLALNATDLWGLNTLLDQLINYSNGKDITIQEVQKFLDEKIDDNIFSLVDAVVAGNKKLAYKLLDNQRKLGEDDFKIFAMILRQFRILLEMRTLLDRQPNLTSELIAKEVGVHPYVAKKSMPLVKKFSLDKLKNIYSELFLIDKRTKTGEADQSIMIDLFVAGDK